MAEPTKSEYRSALVSTNWDVAAAGKLLKEIYASPKMEAPTSKKDAVAARPPMTAAPSLFEMRKELEQLYADKETLQEELFVEEEAEDDEEQESIDAWADGLRADLAKINARIEEIFTLNLEGLGYEELMDRLEKRATYRQRLLDDKKVSAANVILREMAHIRRAMDMYRDSKGDPVLLLKGHTDPDAAKEDVSMFSRTRTRAKSGRHNFAADAADPIRIADTQLGLITRDFAEEEARRLELNLRKLDLQLMKDARLKRKAEAEDDSGEESDSDETVAIATATNTIIRDELTHAWEEAFKTTSTIWSDKKTIAGSVHMGSRLGPPPDRFYAARGVTDVEKKESQKIEAKLMRDIHFKHKGHLRDLYKRVAFGVSPVEKGVFNRAGTEKFLNQEYIRKYFVEVWGASPETSFRYVERVYLALFYLLGPKKDKGAEESEEEDEEDYDSGDEFAMTMHEISTDDPGASTNRGKIVDSDDEGGEQAAPGSKPTSQMTIDDFFA